MSLQTIAYENAGLGLHVCHIQYKKSVSMVSMNMKCSFQYLPSEGQIVPLGSTSKIECFVYLVAMENEIIGFF